jgi:3-deoxy-manno-octulosonate cytidylyltransferase (CMP-KDO synthetase)
VTIIKSFSFIVVIPARYASSRLPGKPLSLIAGRPMIQWVWEKARASGAAEVIVATDDERIKTACGVFGADVEMTSAAHTSGTDRLAEVVNKRNFADSMIVVNLQGDEPMIPPQVIRAVAFSLHENHGCQIATPVTPILSEKQLLDANCVKAVRALDGTAMYFSRAPIPWSRDDLLNGQPAGFERAWRHIGLYAYRAAGLRQFAAWPPTSLEKVEKLEQLRALEHGMKIYLLALSEAPPGGVDTAEDLASLNASLGSG